jgi:hypothetical protein
MIENASYSPRWKGSAKKYLKEKLVILEDHRGFGIHPTEEELQHLKTLKTQTAIDNGILSIIEKRWG